MHRRTGRPQPHVQAFPINRLDALCFFPSFRQHNDNDAEAILKKVAGIPVTSWNYIGHDPKQFRHYGPMGQDFFAAFGQDGVGQIGSETTINSSDLSGVLMLAVDALEKRTTDLQAENAELKAREAHLRERIEKLEQLFNTALASQAAP